jgi:hypothetical protein
VTPAGIAPAPVLVTLAGEVVRALPSYTKVRAELAVKELPVTVIVVPKGPEGGLKVIEGDFQLIEVNGMFSPKS